jgi:DnaJ-class molecular chaperone
MLSFALSSLYLKKIPITPKESSLVKKAYKEYVKLNHPDINPKASKDDYYKVIAAKTDCTIDSLKKYLGLQR